MKSVFDKYQAEINELRESFSERKLSSIKKSGKYIFDGDKKYLNLSSNDYIGVAEDRAISLRFKDSSDFSFGAASSRLLTGGSPVCLELENLLVEMFKKDKALIFNSGYHANVGIMSALAGKRDVVFSDKLNHASIIDGVRLSGAKMLRYKHLDYAHLEELLKKHRSEYDRAIIVSETLFSMDGDVADLGQLVSLKEKYNAILILDEAHAFGVFGKKGLGIAEAQGFLNEADLVVATFGKAVGSVGAFCCGHAVLVDYLINKSRSLIFSTALPEINVAFSHYILSEVLPNTQNERRELWVTAQKLREKFKDFGLETIGESHIVPVILGSNENAIKVSEGLIKNGYYLLPIRHPTVAVNSSRVRISLRSDISFEEVEQLPQLIKNILTFEESQL